MGTPTSMTRKALEEFVLYGAYPSFETIKELGFDKKLLNRRFIWLKDQLSHLEGYQSLELVCDYVMSRTISSWEMMVNEAELTGTRVLRFTDRSYPESPLLTISPTGSGHYIDVEVFLTRGGDLIIWYGDGREAGEPEFTRHHTVTSALKRLESFETDQHVFKKYAWHQYSVSMLLYENLARFLSESINAKKSRLATLIELQDGFAAVDARNSL